MSDVLATAFEVMCDAASCPKQGVRRRVQLQEVGDGVVASPALMCRHCGCAVYALSIPRETANA